MSDEHDPAGDQRSPAQASDPTDGAQRAGGAGPTGQPPGPAADPHQWDPWAPPAAPPVPPAAPVPPGALLPPDVQSEPSSDVTSPVDLNRTQEIPAPPAPQAPPVPPVWAEPTGWLNGPADAQHPANAVTGQATPQTTPPTGWPQDWPGHDVGSGLPADAMSGRTTPTPNPWDPITGRHADAGYAGQPTAWVGGQPAQSGTSPQQKGPGWGALVAVAAVASLVAATLGGLFGGWLGATDRVDFGRLDRTPSSIPKAGAGASQRPAGSIAAIAATALPSVVTIKVKGADGAGTGSGFVLDHDGHILTNNHVVAGAAGTGTITVELSNGKEIEATIAGRDTSYDLAVLKTGRTDLQPLTMGVSKDVVVGDQVIAVGAPLGLESTVTAGIVSAVNRPVSPGGDGNEQSFINAIQTDAAINPGNSGGPLLDMQGHVVGVNSAIARVPGSTDAQSGNIGVGFSIPSDQAVKTAEQLIKTGKAQHPIIGVVLDRGYTGDGVRILKERTASSGNPVDPGGPAGKAGVKPGDVIVEFDGHTVTDADDLVVQIRAKSVGDQVTMKVRRGSETISVRLTLSGTSGG